MKYLLILSVLFIFCQNAFSLGDPSPIGNPEVLREAPIEPLTETASRAGQWEEEAYGDQIWPEERQEETQQRQEQEAQDAGELEEEDIEIYSPQDELERQVQEEKAMETEEWEEQKREADKQDEVEE